MARFRYSLQNILNIKEKMETQAKQEFGTAQAALNVETEHLERLKERRREYEEQSAGLLKGERMAEAMKERKMHETLREKAFEAFLQEENHAESKAIDELTSYTYGQKNR